MTAHNIAPPAEQEGPRVLKGSSFRANAVRDESYQLVDLQQQTELYLAGVQARAESLVTEKRGELEDERDRLFASLREAARTAGLADARAEAAAEAEARLQAARQTDASELSPLIAKIGAAVQQVRTDWVAEWTAALMPFVREIVLRILHRESEAGQAASVELVTDLLRRVTGASGIQVHLHPTDHAVIGNVIPADAAGGTAFTVVADPDVPRLGCRVETSHGVLDATPQAMLERIFGELGLAESGDAGDEEADDA